MENNSQNDKTIIIDGLLLQVESKKVLIYRVI